MVGRWMCDRVRLCGVGLMFHFWHHFITIGHWVLGDFDMWPVVIWVIDIWQNVAAPTTTMTTAAATTGPNVIKHFTSVIYEFS